MFKAWGFRVSRCWARKGFMKRFRKVLQGFRGEGGRLL